MNLRRRMRIFRLLPTVIAVGSGLLVLKTSGLVHAAYAQGETKPAAAAAEPVPANRDYAGSEEDQTASTGTVDVLGSLARRRRELDARESQLNIQATMLAAAESRVDAKIAQLKQLQAQIDGLLAQRDEAQKAQVAALVKTYSSMKPRDAARIFDQLPDTVAVPVAQQMKSDVLALVLASMTADNAKALTVKLADRLALPEATDAPNPAQPATAAGQPAPARAAAKPAAAAKAAAAPATTKTPKS
ncbi:MAG TPA: hypothetical protein VHC40_03825 [Rhizomicrobium sp.]|nr:hypothetical protein [Rhizomicrobium sp.]